MEETKRVTDAEALELHASGRPGKLEITPTKPLTTQRDLSLAYSPGVAAPVRAIAADPDKAYDYTARGNLVAIISNGTAILGLGNLGALASKPVMEGKAVLFKRFADIDGIDIEVDTTDIDAFINAVRYLGPSWGGINLEDIRAPDCFIIEQRLRELMDIPVFHDDQHGTAIIAAAGLVNACQLTGRNLKDVRIVVNGAGAAGIACTELVKLIGVPHDNVVLCDTKGTIYQGRTEGMNQWKSAHAAKTDARTLEEALNGADVFIGVSAKGAVTQDMVRKMAPKPIIFAMANPDPEITPEEAKAAVPDAIVATGRSDYANQVNNVLGFPYIFRGALDVRATTINEEMKVAAVHALAGLAREDVPDEVEAAYAGRRLQFGPDYIIPVPFDPRLITTIPVAVAKAAVSTGVARRPITDWDGYITTLRGRLDPTASKMEGIFSRVRANPKRVIFAEGEEERMVRAALAFKNGGYGEPILLAHEHVVQEHLKALGHAPDELQVINSRLCPPEKRKAYTDVLYERLQRRGALYRDCQRRVNQRRNTLAALMVAMGDADAMITGATRPFTISYDDISDVIDPLPGERVIGMTMLMSRGHTVFLADTTIAERPEAQDLADIAIQAAHAVRQLGHVPRVAFLSYSNFGQPWRPLAERVRGAIREMDSREVDFEYDGEMTAEVALDYELMQRLYPFCRLTAAANVLIMPALNAANISAKMLQKLAGNTVVGPVLLGLSKPAQIVQMGASVNDIFTAAVIAAHGAVSNERG